MMRIAYFMYPGACYIGAGDGQKMQANIWRKALEELGHEVVMVNPWEHYDWKSFDIVHVFGFGLWNYDVIHWGSRINPNFVFSPIIDTNTPMWKYRLFSKLGCKRLRLFSQNYAMRQLKGDVKLFFARTQYEAEYITKGYDISPDKVALVPLSYRNENASIPNTQREPFCLFAGTMTQERKNVGRLIDAANKYGFRLVLVGNTGNEASLKAIKQRIGNNPNIEIKGFVSDEELQQLYNTAKVFALPSLNEGVGLVALEAAVCGCNIVITNLGGPKEYYSDGLARLVNPYDVDDIGKAVVASMQDDAQQPALAKHITEKYNTVACAKMLETAYFQCLKK